MPGNAVGLLAPWPVWPKHTLIPFYGKSGKYIFCAKPTHFARLQTHNRFRAHVCEKMEESKKRCFCEEESSSGSTSGSKNVAIESHASISVEAKRARSCSRYDTFTELERFAAEFGVQYSKICRPQNFGFIGEEGTDMSFLVLPLRMEPKLDIAVLTTESLNHLLETEQ